jgi:hypothetical protein
MLYFPQISTECLAQFPLRKQQLYRTSMTEAMDSRRLRAADVDAAAVRWELSYKALTDDEKQRIEDLFVAAQGRLESFVFVDPTANLLGRTDDLTTAQWARGPLVSVSGAIPDPFGGEGAWAVHNESVVDGAVSQAIACPATLRYCFSVYLRSDENVECTLRMRNASGQMCVPGLAQGEWRRMFCSGSLPDAEGPLTFELGLPAAATVHAYGFQVDAQPAPSAYKRSVVSAVYPNTRFEDDVLQVRTDGVNNHAMTVRLTSRASR